MNQHCILIFLKFPEKNKVKTRLAKSVGPINAVNLYKNFVLDTLTMLEKCRYRIIICYYPVNAKNGILNWLGTKYTLWPQTGEHLGEKMANAFEKAFKQGFNQALVIGTDIPSLCRTIIDEAFESLINNDAVIGPAFDGGYYLIGFNKSKFLPCIFENIPWSTKIVFEKTFDLLKQKQLSTHILPVCRDIDEYSDLIDFIKYANEKKLNTSNTFKYLSFIGLI